MIDSLIAQFPWLYIPAGILVTLKYALLSVGIGFILSIFLLLLKITHIKCLNILASIYTSIFRGTPLLVQLSIVYYAMPGLLDIQISAFTAAITAFSLNSAAYLSETLRSGIQSIDKGQFEAAQALGVSYPKMMKDIILPQAMRNTLPSLVNEVIDLIKETAIISIIGVSDIMRRAQIIAAEEYSYLQPLLIAAACYYVLVLALSSLAKILEKKLKIA